MLKLKFSVYFLCSILSLASAQQQCQLTNPANQYENVAIGFPRLSNRAKSIGQLNITVLFVDFRDKPAGTQTPQQIFSIISPTTENFFATNSYSKLKISFFPHFKWLRMSKYSTAYSMSPSISFESQRAYISEAVKLASGSVDFSKSDEIVVMTNPLATAIPYGPAFCSSTGWGVSVKGKEFINAVTSGSDLSYWKNYWLIHELSHTLGLPDLYAFSGQQFGYTGGWSIMGNINAAAREFFGWERWLLGWLSDTQIVCVTAKGTTFASLSPIETISSKKPSKIVVITLSDRRAVVVESRRSLGYDTLAKQGILVYLVDTSLRTGSGPIQVLPINTNDNTKSMAALSVGQSLTFESVSVYYTLNEIDSDQVKIVYN